MKKTRLGITHPGAAHADDVLSAAYLIATGRVDTIERRSPTPEELSDPDVIVFDIGGQFDQVLNNFDHHQFDRDAPQTCAFSLILQAHGNYHMWKSTFPWIKGTEEMDSKGPFAVANRIGVDFESLKPFVFSPFAGYFIDQFAKCSSISNGDYLFDLLQGFGDYVLSKSDRLTTAWKYFDETTTFEEIDGIVVAVFKCRGSFGIESWLEGLALEIHCTVTHDDRGDGLSLFRVNACPRIDFSRCEGASNVSFAHKNGFVAKTTDDNWQSVLRQAITSRKDQT